MNSPTTPANLFLCSTSWMELYLSTISSLMLLVNTEGNTSLKSGLTVFWYLPSFICLIFNISWMSFIMALLSSLLSLSLLLIALPTSARKPCPRFVLAKSTSSDIPCRVISAISLSSSFDTTYWKLWGTSAKPSSTMAILNLSSKFCSLNDLGL